MITAKPRHILHSLSCYWTNHSRHTPNLSDKNDWWAAIFNPRLMLLEFQMWATLCIDPAATTTTTTIHYNHISVNLDWFPSSSLILSSTESWWSNFFPNGAFPPRMRCHQKIWDSTCWFDNHNDSNGWLFMIHLPGFVCASVWNKSIMFNTRVSMEVGK